MHRGSRILTERWFGVYIFTSLGEKWLPRASLGAEHDMGGRIGTGWQSGESGKVYQAWEQVDQLHQAGLLVSWSSPVLFQEPRSTVKVDRVVAREPLIFLFLKIHSREVG